MKLSAIIVCLFFAFSVKAQPPVKGSVQQAVTFKLMDIAIVEKVSASSASIQTVEITTENYSSVKVLSANKWMIETKNTLVSKRNLPVVLDNHFWAFKPSESLTRAQLHTLSKP